MEIYRIFKKYKIDEVYNLAAQSFVGTSFNSPITTSNITAIGALRLLEVIRTTNPKIKFYQASSSEMFGNLNNSVQNEKTSFDPKSPYGISKLFAHNCTKNYRDSYNLFAVSGILFNHESPLRGEEFVTRKITLGLTRIITRKQKYIELGNLYAKRDWGYAKDYVECMWKMLQKKKAEDFVIATGKSYTIKDFINVCSKILNIKTKWIGKGLNEKLIDLNSGNIIVKINKKYFRPAEVNLLRGDYKKAKKKLKWKPKTNLFQLAKIMLEEEKKYLKN